MEIKTTHMNFGRELVIDIFAGWGGADTGIEQAIGRPVDIAINHDPVAIASHRTNHPHTHHLISDVTEVDPIAATGGWPVGLLWASPDCRHFSKAKGGKPVSRAVRSLAWVVVEWARKVRPRVICLENVEEFQTWGPLADDGRPCPIRQGQTFQAWVAALRHEGYAVEWRELRACDYGAPTIRKRFFLVARCDHQPIVWPPATHGPPNSLPVLSGKLKPWRTAAECIDWTIPCPSIFGRKKPLADATCRRIAKGILRYVIEAAEPFILTNTTGHPGAAVSAPLRTVTTGGHHALVTAFLAKHYSGVVGSDLRSPIGTVTAVDHHSLVAASIVKLRGTNTGQPATEPLHTISAQGTHFAEVRAFLVKYYGNDQDGVPLTEPMHTIPTRDRFGLVLVNGDPYAIADIGLRMLTPRELCRAQGFSDDHIIDHDASGHPITKTDQVRMCGNSVCPPLAKAIVQANYDDWTDQRKVA